MNLNCLTCQGMKRTDSDTDIREGLVEEKPHISRILDKTERSWSGNLVPRPSNYEKMRSRVNLAAANKVKKTHLRFHSTGPFEGTDSPRLVRSGGLRRDWSFEDLRQRVKG